MSDSPLPSKELTDTYMPPLHGWTCFHCGDTFTDERSARTHFGPTPDSEPGCIIKMQAGDRSLLRALRVVEAERDERRRQQCEEDSELHRALHAKSAEMATAVRRAEEQGYARGLEDAKKHPETLGLTRAGQPPCPSLSDAARRVVDEFSCHTSATTLIQTNLPKLVGRLKEALPCSGSTKCEGQP